MEMEWKWFNTFAILTQVECSAAFRPLNWSTIRRTVEVSQEYMLEPDMDSQEDKEELLPQSHLQVNAS